MDKQYFDKNDQLLKIGQVVLTRIGKYGIIVEKKSCQYRIFNEGEDDVFFTVKYFPTQIDSEPQGGFFPKSLTIIEEGEAMLWILEQ